MEVLIPPDPVKVTLAWLAGKYPWPVTIAKNRPSLEGRVVIVRRTGGTTPNRFTDGAWLTVECFAPNDLQASELAHRTWGLLHAMSDQVIGGVQVYRVQTLAAPNDFPLAQPGEMQRPRYTMSAQIQTRTVPVEVTP